MKSWILVQIWTEGLLEGNCRIGFWVLGSGFWVLGFGFRGVPDFPEISGFSRSSVFSMTLVHEIVDFGPNLDRRPLEGNCRKPILSTYDSYEETAILHRSKHELCAYIIAEVIKLYLKSY